MYGFGGFGRPGSRIILVDRGKNAPRILPSVDLETVPQRKLQGTTP
jgi:hypothetical protein